MERRRAERSRLTWRTSAALGKVIRGAAVRVFNDKKGKKHFKEPLNGEDVLWSVRWSSNENIPHLQ